MDGSNEVGESSTAAAASTTKVPTSTLITLTPGDDVVIKLKGKEVKFKIEYEENKIRAFTDGYGSHNVIKVDNADSSFLLLCPERATRGRFPFLELSLELREMVYDYLFASDRLYPWSWFCCSKPIEQIKAFMKMNNFLGRKIDTEDPPCGLPFTGRQMLEECIPFLLKNKAFQINTGTRLKSFLLSIGPIGRSHLQDLELRGWEYGNCSDWIDQLAKCRKLASLILTKPYGHPVLLNDYETLMRIDKAFLLREKVKGLSFLRHLFIDSVHPEATARLKEELKRE